MDQKPHNVTRNAAAVTSNAERQRLFRVRRRRGLRVYRIRLADAEVDELDAKGYLENGDRNAAAVIAAVEAFISDCLMGTQ